VCAQALYLSARHRQKKAAQRTERLFMQENSA